MLPPGWLGTLHMCRSSRHAAWLCERPRPAAQFSALPYLSDALCWVMQSADIAGCAVSVQRFKAFQSVFRPEPLVYQQFLDAMDTAGAFF